MATTNTTVEVIPPNHAKLMREVMGDDDFSLLIGELRGRLDEIDRVDPEELAGIDPHAIEELRKFLAEAEEEVRGATE
jgi:hypothetical protein